LRTIEDIYQNLKADFGAKSGFEVGDGCDLAVRLWAAAAQIQSLEVQADWVLDQSFPQTAQGAYLDHHGTMRGLTRVPAAKAAGQHCILHRLLEQEAGGSHQEPERGGSG